MATVVVQMGHVPRTKGATGTSGHRGSEQEFARQVGVRLAERLDRQGRTVYLIGADDPIPKSDVFVALHQDGSANPKARGASIGFPPSSKESAQFGAIFKRLYAVAGWPGGFRPDNYTQALRTYYAWRRTNAPVRLLVEHGFATNRADADWMWDNLDVIAGVHADTIAAWFGGATPEDDDMTPTQAQQLEQIWGAVFGGTGGGPIGARLQEIHEGVRAVRCEGGTGGGNLSDADVERVAVRVADLLAARLSG
jgi:hypothetical protein